MGPERAYVSDASGLPGLPVPINAAAEYTRHTARGRARPAAPAAAKSLQVIPAVKLGERPKYQPISADELLAGTLVEESIEGVMPRHGLVVVNGSPGAGKSTLMASAGKSMRIGEDSFGRRTRPSTVGYWIGEGRASVNACMQVYRQHFGLTAEQLPRFITEPFNALEPLQVNAFAVGVGKLDVLFFDGLRRVPTRMIARL